MDGKHRGTGSASAAREVQKEKEKRRKRVNIAEKRRGKEEERESNVRTEETMGRTVNGVGKQLRRRSGREVRNREERVCCNLGWESKSNQSGFQF